MFSNVTVHRGFTEATFNTTGFGSGEITVPRTSVLSLMGIEMKINVPLESSDPLGPFSALVSALDPAILYLLSMSRIALILELEHKAYAKLSREQPIEVRMKGELMMRITPKQVNGKWAADLQLFGDGPESSGEMEWPAQGWAWEQMVTNALAFPAMSIIGSMGLAEMFTTRLQNTDAEFTVSNPRIDPSRVEHFKTSDLGGIQVDIVGEDEEPLTPQQLGERIEQRLAEAAGDATDEAEKLADEILAEIPAEAQGEDEFDIAYRQLLAQYGNKKEGPAA